MRQSSTPRTQHQRRLAARLAPPHTSKPRRHGVFGAGILEPELDTTVSTAPRPIFGPDRQQWVNHARDLIRTWHALPEADAGGIISVGAEIDRVLARVRGIDEDIAAELQAEYEDPDTGPAESWGPEWDADTWEPDADEDLDQVDADEDLDAPAPLLSLDQWIAEQGRRYEALATEAGAMIARTLAELAELVRFVGATTPGSAVDRLASLERDAVDDMRHAYASACR